ncbi:MAG: hypothetical protein AB7G39_15745 [Alphaproteobacteria bacterium]
MTAGTDAAGRGGIAALWGEARALGGVLAAGAAAVGGYAVRYAFVEPERLGAACERSGPWWCPFRTGLIVFTEFGGFGWLALLAALAGLGALLASRATAARRLAFAAMILGGAGMILYNATLSTAAVVLALLCLVRAR